MNKTQYINHALYLNQETIKEEITSLANKLGDTTYKLEELWDYKNNLYGVDSLIVQPQYFTQEMITTINEKHINGLYFEDRLISGFFKKEPNKYKTLTDLSFLEKIPHLKSLQIDGYTSFFSDKPIIKIEDYTPIEYLKRLEYIYIPDNGDFPISVDIDFFKLKKLKEVTLQYSKNNRTIYLCENIESIETRYQEKDLNIIKNWKKLKYFSAYCDNLESFSGLDKFTKLEVFKLETTSKFKTFEGTKSKSIKTFFIYTEARKTSTTLNGLSGLKNVDIISLNGFKQLESINDLSYCLTLKELTFEKCKIPNDVSTLSSLVNLEKLVFDDCKNIESLAFIRKLPNLKYLSFDGNTKVMDGNLDFLKELSNINIEIYFTDRKHYNIKCKDLK